MRDSGVFVTCCRDAEDTNIVKCALDHASVGLVDTRAEDTGILVLSMHHYDKQNHHSMILTTSKGSYGIGEIIDPLTERERRNLLLCHSFTGNDTVSPIFGFSKEKLFEKICRTDPIEKQVAAFYDSYASKNEVVKAGANFFHFIYNRNET